MITPTDIRTYFKDAPANLRPFIEDASSFVEENIPIEELESEKVDRITKFVALHLVRLSMENDSEVSAGYPVGNWLSLTDYGRTAISQDPTGSLERISNSGFEFFVPE